MRNLALSHRTVVTLPLATHYTEIPSSLGECTAMTKLNLQSNKLSGKIPVKISQMEELQKLKLNNNKFSGELPDNLKNLVKLKKLHVHNNKLSGIIPKELDKKPGVALNLVYGEELELKLCL